MAIGVKELLIAAGSLVIGLMLGGLGPRAEVRALQVKLDACEARPCDPQDLGADLARLFAGRPFAADPSGPTAPPPAPRRARTAEPEPAAGSALDDDEARRERGEAELIVVGGDADAAGDGERGGPPIPEDLVEMMDIRRRQVRAALVEDADPDDAQLAAIDDAAGDMNDELFSIAEDFAAVVRSGQEPSRRDAMEFAADTLDVLLTAEDRMLDTLDDDQIDALDERATDPLGWVDPALVEVFTELDR